tara:strand:- start:6620 stop:7687 length:1068 start_codon:yes stop_codon:yes gene_type:complete
MLISEIFSNTLNQKVNVDKNILAMISPKTCNQNRKISIAQKLRKKSLSLFFNNNSINDNILNPFNKLLNLNISSAIDLINFDFTPKFKRIVKQEKVVFSNKEMKPTDTGKEVLNMFDEKTLRYFKIIIHGSQADGEITKYSDFDISIFLENGMINDEEKLNEVFFYLKAINKKINFHDPISHHSVFLNLCVDLDCYPESFMPIKVFEKSVLPKDQKIKFNATRDDLDLKIENFFNILITIIKIDNEKRINNQYDLKQLISSYFMLIILEYEITKNEYLDKKTIFHDEIKKYKSKKQLEIFEQASLIRSNWPDLNFSNIGVSTEFIEGLVSDSINISKKIQNDKIIEDLSVKYLDI